MKKTAVYQRKRVSDPGWYNTWIQSPLWLKGFGATVAACGIVYLVNAMWGRLSPGNAWGITYGSLALVLFVLLALYGIRRRTRRVKGLHRAWYLLQFHVYGGVLFLLFMLMHSNFNVPDGTLTGWLWGLSIWIVVSGLLGNVIQKWIPAKLNNNLSTEVNFGRIPELVEETKKRAEKCVAGGGEEVQSFFAKHIAPLMAAPHARFRYVLDTAAAIHRYEHRFTLQRKYVSEADKKRLNELEKILSDKLTIDAHYTLQRILRGWLYLHIPVSVLLLALIVAHLIAVFYY